MFAYVPVLTALLAFSGVHHVHAINGNKEDFQMTIDFSFDDPEAGMITAADKKVISDAIVDSFNSVHDTNVIELYKFDYTPKSVNQGTSYLSHLLPNALTTGGTYSGSGTGSGGNCRRNCSNDDMLTAADVLAFTHKKWQDAFVANLQQHGLAAATNAVIKVDGETFTLSAEPVRDPNKEDFQMTIEFSFDDPKSEEISKSDEDIISNCIVSSFNKVHDTNVIELYKFELNKYEVTRGTNVLSLLRGNDKPTVGTSGNYSGSGTGSGGNCRRNCSNDDMLTADVLAFTHKKWEKACNDCIATSGSAALSDSSNLSINIADTDEAEYA
jgi:hypothetical protein